MSAWHTRIFSPVASMKPRSRRAARRRPSQSLAFPGCCAPPRLPISAGARKPKPARSDFGNYGPVSRSGNISGAISPAQNALPCSTKRCAWPACLRGEPTCSRDPEGLSRSRSAGWRLYWPGLLAVEAQGLHHRRVVEAEQEGRAVPAVDVLAEGPGRHREHVFVFPVQPFAADDRVAGALDHVKVRAADTPAGPRLLAGTQ